MSVTEGTISITEGVEIRGRNVDVALAIDDDILIFDISGGEDVVVAGLTLASLSSGSGINFSGTGTLRVVESKFSKLGSPYEAFQGGITQSDGNLVISKSTFSNNFSSSGGAISTISGNLRIVDSRFNGNGADNSGGAIDFRGGELVIIDSSFSGNIADEIFSGGRLGGAVQIANENSDTRAWIFGSTFERNEARSGGAIRNTGTLVIRDSNFHENESRRFGGFNNESWGGAIYNLGTLTVVDTTFTANFGEAVKGAAIYSAGNGRAVLNRVTVAGSGRGPAIAVGSGVVRLIDSELTENTSGAIAVFDSEDPEKPSVLWVSGDNIYSNSNYQRAGGIEVAENALLRVLNFTQFVENSATDRSGYGNDSQGGAAIFSKGNVRIYDAGFHRNSTDTVGGAVYAAGGSLTAVRSVFTTNVAELGGGAINVSDARVKLVDSQIGGDRGQDGNRAYSNLDRRSPSGGGGGCPVSC
jgi:hypothetical protein